MTSAHGNKNLVLAGLMCLLVITFVLGGIHSEKRAKLRLYEKQYERALSHLQENNQKFMSVNEK